MPRKFSEMDVKCRCKICWFGKQVQTNSRVKGGKLTIFKSTYPGQCVSTDQLVSSSKGLFLQMKGKSTRRRYKYATIFVDQFSRFTFIALQRSLSSEETIKSKLVFEAKVQQHGVNIEHNYADNGRFADNAFCEQVCQEGQTLTFCGVNAHWKNGVAEKAI